MKLIIVDEKHGGTRSFVLKGWMRGLLAAGLLGLPLLLGLCGYQIYTVRDSGLYNTRTAQDWAERFGDQEQEVLKIKQDTLAQIQGLAVRMAGLQARLLRLDALGERLTGVAGIEDGEFDFTQEPALGGPIAEDSSILGEQEQRHDSLNIIQALDELTMEIADRQQQLEILDSVLSERQTREKSQLAGSPVKKGWMSSPFGRRIDPFTGEIAWHQGVDFATGSLGVDVLAVAAGVVTFAGDRSGYGLMVKVSHGNDLETLYAHGQEVLVKAGDIIKKGQVIALSGSSGRSTGPHVHFEVHKSGRVVDPATYIQKTKP